MVRANFGSLDGARSPKRASHDYRADGLNADSGRILLGLSPALPRHPSRQSFASHTVATHTSRVIPLVTLGLRSTVVKRRIRMGLAHIKMPQLGESVTEGTVDKWLKHEGDFVKRDEPLVEVVTDKVNAEIPSPFEGKLVKIAVSEGETVRVGAVIAQIETGAATSAPAKDREAGVANTEVPPEPSADKAPAPPPAASPMTGSADGGER